MDKYNVTVNGCEFEVEILEDAGSRAAVSVNGVSYEVEIRSSGQPERAEIFIPSPAAMPAPMQNIPSPSVAPSAGGPGVIQAPMPGVVLEVIAQVGQKVKRGDVVLRVEAMKMENDILAPTDGTVKEIKVEKGSQVKEHDVMMILGD